MMTDTPNPQAIDDQNQDAAWVVIDSEMEPDALVAFCHDVERLLRINSMLEFMSWEAQGDNAYRIHVKNLSTQRDLETVLSVMPAPDGLSLTYDGGLKTSTRLRVEAAEGGGSKLTITDDYSGTSMTERKARMDEVDTSLVQWGHDLHHFLRSWRRWSGVGVWRWYMRRMWLPMKPSSRRISYMLIGITALEFIVFLFVFVIFWFELHRLVL